jgi:hypothetical protein
MTPCARIATIIRFWSCSWHRNGHRPGAEAAGNFAGLTAGLKFVPGYQSLNRIPDPNRFNPPDRLSFALTIELEIVLIMNYEPTRENEFEPEYNLQRGAALSS